MSINSNNDSLSLSLFAGGNSPDADLSSTASAPLPHLRWEGTPTDNSRDSIEKNRFPFVPGKICPSRKLKAEQVQQIRYLLGEGISKAEIARTFAISRSQIILLARGEIYRDIL
jgi:hypothetical protein